MIPTHPEYNQFIDDWVKLRDAYKGERAIKEKGKAYLPPTRGMRFDGCDSTSQSGYQDYLAYKQRARFYPYFRKAIEYFTGIAFRNEWAITLPSQLEYLIDDASKENDNIQSFLRRIVEEQLISGRTGIAVDVRDDGRVYLAAYDAEKIKNWRDDFVVLDESAFELGENYSWTAVKIDRVISLESGNCVHKIYRDGELVSEIAPTAKGVPLDELPFVFVNTKDLLAKPDISPLIALANLCISVYQSDADYRQNLFMQGQDTLVVIGGIGVPDGQPLRVGAGAMLNVEAGGDAKYVGVNSNGLAEQRLALDADKELCAEEAGKLKITSGNESGYSRSIRMASQTASLTQIIRTAAEGLAEALRIAARWVGADESEISVTPNFQFTENELPADDFLKLTTARSQGFPLSFESLHEIARNKGLTKFSYEEELDKIAEENATVGLSGSINYQATFGSEDESV